MNEPSPTAHSGHKVDAFPPSRVLISPWARIKEHKVLQWSLAYLGAALALAHGQELLAHNFRWPELVGHVLIGTLIVGFPVAIALAWYHGHRGMTRLSAGEMTVVSLLLVIGAGLLMALVRPNEERAPTSSSQSAAAPTASVAVVPFVNLTGDPSKDYFSDGMAEALIDSLTQVPNLKVPSRTSSFAYKGRSADIRRIAQDLGVSSILEGSVRSAGDRIRVTAQLVDASTGYHRWSRSYDRQFGDIFELEDELAAAIVEVLRGSLDSAHTSQADRSLPTRDPQAYDLFLQARSMSRLGNPENLRRAVAIFDEVLARDPGFAKAWASRAITLTTSWLLGTPLPQSLERAERDARQALALDPSLPMAHTALGQLNAVRGNWLAAESSLLAARSAAPNDPLIRTTHAALVLIPGGRIKQARAEMVEAYRLAPADPLVLAQNAYVEAAFGSPAQAVKFADLAVTLGYPHSGVIQATYALAAERNGRCPEADAQPPPPIGAAALADVLHRVCVAKRVAPATKADARSALRQLASKLNSTAPTPIWELLTLAFVALDDLDGAYGLLDRAPQFGLSSAVLWRPETRSLRRDPRFQAIAARTNFTDYWKQYGPPDDCDLRGSALICQ